MFFGRPMARESKFSGRVCSKWLTPQKPNLPPALPTFLETSAALASFLTDCLLPELLLAAGIGTLLRILWTFL
jgi:hypothetical protein